jgi:type I restriction enzyme S subunit
VGWESQPFEKCIEKVIYTKKIQRKDFLEEGGFPIISQEDAFVNGYWNDSEDIFQVEQPVVVFGDHTKVLKYVDFDFVLGADGVKILKPKEFLYSRFFYYQLQAADLDSLGYARHYKLLKQLNIRYPSIEEQQRIVTTLDKAFAAIATATANAEKNLQNARELFESSLQAVFAERGEGWVEHDKPLAELCELIVDCEHKTAPTQEEGIPSIRTPNVGKGQLLLDGVYRVSKETYREWTRRAEPQPSDLILAREAPAGNVAVIPDNLKVCLGQRTVLIRPNLKVFNPEFLVWMLLQPQMQQQLLAHSRGATVQHVNMKDIRALDVGSIPSLLLQEEIVSVVNKAHQATQQLEMIYQKKLTTLTTLKQSLLKKAFSGELH